MATEVILPKLGQTMDTGAIVEWLKNEGEPVKRGDVLFTVESDKAVLEVEATARGYMRKILVPAGQEVPVLTVVGLITRDPDEEIEPATATVQVAGVEAPAPAPVLTVEQHDTQPLEAAGRIFASPRARKTAVEQGVALEAVTGSGPEGRIVEQDILDYAEALPKATPVAARTADALGVDIASLSGTGTGGRVTKADVAAAAAASAVAPVPAPRPVVPLPLADAPIAEAVPMAGVRRIIAERMSASTSATARVTLVTEADATDLVRVREMLKDLVSDEWGFSPGYNDILGLIAARALREFPYMNARLNEQDQIIERLPGVNLGMAVDTEKGLLVPVIRGADELGLRAFGTEFRTLVDRARIGRSLPEDLSGGTFTITNLGMYDIDAFTPIINLPEAAILGVGRIHPKPVVQEDQVVVRKMWTMSLVFDHRLVDGAPAARFLQRIKQLVESPFLLLA